MPALTRTVEADIAGDAVASPCTSVCRMDPATALCTGCARTLDEIGGWAGYSADEKRAVLRRIASRLAARRAPD